MKRRPLISGASLSELLASAGGDPDEELSDGETPDEPETVRIDPDCAEKLEHARSRILNLIKEKRPRFVPAFELIRYTQVLRSLARGSGEFTRTPDHYAPAPTSVQDRLTEVAN